MSHRKVLSHGNNNKAPFSWEKKPEAPKFCFRDFEALALGSSPAPPSFYGGDSHDFDHVVCKIPPPPCGRLPAMGSRWEEDPFVAAYKECTKSVKNGKFVKKSKWFVFSCKSADSCQIRDDGFLKLPTHTILASTRK